MEGENVTLDQKTFKALAVGTRLDILKLLGQKQYTLSDLSDLLGMSHSTVKEHLTVLVQAELIKIEDTDRKWKYYSLTWKGKRLVQPHEVRVLFTFVISIAILFFVVLFNFVSAVPGLTSDVMSQDAQTAQLSDTPHEEKTAATTRSLDGQGDDASVAFANVEEENEEIEDVIEPISVNNPLLMISKIVALVAALFAAFSLGWLLKRKPTIIIKGEKKK